MKKVVFLTKYSQGGASSRYRFYNFKDYFEGFDLEYKPLLSDIYIKNLYKKNKNSLLLIIIQIFSVFVRILYLITASSKNYYIIEKELFPNFPYFFEKILLLNKNYALDYDDYVGASYKQNKYKRIFLKNKLNNLVKNAVFTTVGNRWYFDEFKVGNLIYLPTVIDYKLYEEKYSQNAFKKIGDSVNIVWIGSSSTLKYLKIIEEPFKELSLKFSLKLIVIGGEAPFFAPNVISLKWSKEDEISNIALGDIGIMPLYDTLWEKGKCGFKLIQYMGVGLPVLGSPSPANNEIINGNGFICESQEDWKISLTKLIESKELRKQMGTISFERMKSSYSYQVWGPFYNQLIKSKFK